MVNLGQYLLYAVMEFVSSSNNMLFFFFFFSKSFQFAKY